MKHQSQSSKLTGSLDASNSLKLWERIEIEKTIVDLKHEREVWERETKWMTLIEKIKHVTKKLEEYDAKTIQREIL